MLVLKSKYNRQETDAVWTVLKWFRKPQIIANKKTIALILESIFVEGLQTKLGNSFSKIFQRFPKKFNQKKEKKNEKKVPEL